MIGSATFFYSAAERGLTYIVGPTPQQKEQPAAVFLALLVSSGVFIFGMALVLISFKPAADDDPKFQAVLLAPYPLAEMRDGSLVLQIAFSNDANDSQALSDTQSPALNPMEQAKFLKDFGKALANCAQASNATLSIEIRGFASSKLAGDNEKIDALPCVIGKRSLAPKPAEAFNLCVAEQRAINVKELIEEGAQQIRPGADGVVPLVHHWNSHADMMRANRFNDRPGGKYHELQGLLTRRVEVHISGAGGCFNLQPPTS